MMQAECRIKREDGGKIVADMEGSGGSNMEFRRSLEVHAKCKTRGDLPTIC
jgi:hypothetical protein